MIVEKCLRRIQHRVSELSCHLLDRKGSKKVFLVYLGLVFTKASRDGACGKEPTCQCRRCKRQEFDPRIRKIPWRDWQPIPVFLLVRECLTGGFLLAVSHKSFVSFKQNSTLLPGTEVIVWDRLESPLVNILFTTKLLSLNPLSWDMDCLLTL